MNNKRKMKKKTDRGWRCYTMVEYLTSIQKALGLSPSTVRKEEIILIRI
jgi:hypothetical protein